MVDKIGESGHIQYGIEPIFPHNLFHRLQVDPGNQISIVISASVTWHATPSALLLRRIVRLGGICPLGPTARKLTIGHFYCQAICDPGFSLRQRAVLRQ
jgi:hypothetical protein